MKNLFGRKSALRLAGGMTNQTQAQIGWMRRAIEWATVGMRSGKGGPFGAVVVRGGEVVGEGCNEVLATQDPTAHAEIVAIRRASARLGRFHLDDCEIYASCEPCPMCLSAIYWARIPQVYFANTREDAAAIGFADAKLYRELAAPMEQRELQCVPMLREEALVAFSQWQARSDKVSY